MAKYREGKGHPGKRGAPVKEYEKPVVKKAAKKKVKRYGD